jgi:hypothetical protein
VVFLPLDAVRNSYGFSNVLVIGMDTDEILYMGGHFNCRTGGTTFSFTVEGIGAICRYCIGGAVHKPYGRNHVHKVKKERDVERRLPSIERRDELKNLTPKKIWETVCAEANIHHNGEFFEPEAECPPI